MINLLPPILKESYTYARRNVVLRRWIFAFVIALVGLGGITTYGLATMQQSINNYNKQIASSEAFLKKEDFAGTQAKAESISSSFKLVVQVLGKEILFSQLINQIATTLPGNANLTGLNISQTAGALDVTATTTNYQTATQVQVNLADPANKIFTKADIVSIDCDPSKAKNKAYPCTVNIRALFAADNPYLFINSKGAKQ
jgi:Tfp pilus assembly protein PilN